MSNDRFYFARTLSDLHYRDQKDVRRTLPKGTRIRVEETYFGNDADFICENAEHGFRLRLTPRVFVEETTGE